MNTEVVSSHCNPYAKQSTIFEQGRLYQIKEDVLMLEIDEEAEARHESSKKNVRGPRVTIKSETLALCVETASIQDRRIPKYTDGRNTDTEIKQLVSETVFVVDGKSYVLYVLCSHLEELKRRKFIDCI